MLSLFDLSALLVLLTAAFGWLNQVVFHLPSNIGLLLMGMVAALITVAVDTLFPRLQLLTDVGPIAVVAAGLLIGERGPADAMSETTQRYLFGFWTLVDELLNSVLFLLIGIELIVVGANLSFGWLALCAIPVVLLARALSIGIPIYR
jgi:CPA1 family monovalent cation:H+ antiporter